MKKLNIGIMGSYGEGNIGDEAILDGIINTIKAVAQELSFETSIHVYSHNPNETKKIHPGVISHNVIPAGFRSFMIQHATGQIYRTVKDILNLDAVIIGGGGIFYDSTFSKGRNPIGVWHTRVKFLKLLKRKIYIYAVGVESVTKEKSKSYLKKICESSLKVSVRNSESQDRLLKCGVISSINVTQDPVWNLSASAEQKSLSKSIKIGISLRSWFAKDSIEQKNLINELQDSINWLIEHKKAVITLIPFSKGKDNDQRLFEKLSYNQNEQIKVWEGEFSVDEYLNLINEQDIIIGMRLHSIIFSVLTQTPFLGISYSNKVQSMLKSLSLEELSLPIENFSCKEFQEKFQYLINNYSKTKESLRSAVTEMKDREAKNYNLLKQFIVRNFNKQ